jgi:hypothetical protein
MSENQIPKQDYLALITPDVMAVLAAEGFFDALDEALCPADESKPPVPCRTSYENSERILIGLGSESGDFEDIFDVQEVAVALVIARFFTMSPKPASEIKVLGSQADRHERERRGE